MVATVESWVAMEIRTALVGLLPDVACRGTLCGPAVKTFSDWPADLSRLDSDLDVVRRGPAIKTFSDWPADFSSLERPDLERLSQEYKHQNVFLLI